MSPSEASSSRARDALGNPRRSKEDNPRHHTRGDRQAEAGESSSRRHRHRHVDVDSDARRDASDAGDGRRHPHRDEDRHGHRSLHHHRDDPIRESMHRRRHRHREDDDEDRTRRKRRSRSPRQSRGEERHRRGQSIIDDDEEKEPQGKVIDAISAVAEDRHPEDAIPTSASLDIRSHQTSSYAVEPAPLPKDPPVVTQIQRDSWMLPESADASEPGPGSAARGAGDIEDDFFGSLGGAAREKKKKDDRPDPEKLHISSRELNTQLREGKSLDQYAGEAKKGPVYGGPGHQWRMMKLRRVYEAAEEEGKSVEEVAMDRYGSMEEFNEARRERRFLDDRAGPRRGGESGSGSSGRATPTGPPGSRRQFMYADSPGSTSFGGGSGAQMSRPNSRQSFRKPGESAPATPQAGGISTPAARRTSSFQQSGYSSQGEGSKSSSPIPSVFTPNAALRRPPPGPSDLRQQSNMSPSQEPDASPATDTKVSAVQTHGGDSAALLDSAALNKLEAKTMKAELMGAPNAKSLREELEKYKARAQSGGDRGQGFLDPASIHKPPGEQSGTTSDVQMLPTLDGRGRLYDVGRGAPGDAAAEAEAQRRKMGKRPKVEKFQSHDPKTGEVLRREADDDDVTLAELVRQERFGAGAASQKNMDVEMAQRIASDAGFANNVDYLDDNVERLARRKMKSDAMKRQFAIQDFARTKRALDTCSFCWQDEGARPPRAAVVASGTRAYLAIPDHEPLVEGHCLIVPIQHHLSLLEAEDDTWDEIKNFMKNLLQVAHTQGRSVVFFETVRSIKAQRHTYLEAVPVANAMFSQLPMYFKQAILSAGEEWSTHRKLIEFSAQRPMRRSLVPELPYFAVLWDYRGERGYGHVIEDPHEANADAGGGGAGGSLGGDDDEYAMSTGRKGDATFPRWFATEIIGNLLELEPRRWRKPRRLDRNALDAAKVAFRRAGFDSVDWTKQLVADSGGGAGARGGASG